MRLGRTEWRYTPFLQDPEQFCLQLKGYFAYFVEEYGAAIGCPEETQCAVNGACECALDVTEQLAFKQLARKSGTINRDKDMICAVADGVDLSCDHFLADARFAGNNNRTFTGGNSRDYFHHGVERWGTAEKIIMRAGIKRLRRRRIPLPVLAAFILKA
jgi:hypothetical protein